MTFEARDLYPSLIEKVAAIGYSLVMNHPFVDGNKRVAHAAMEIMLILNGAGLTAAVEDQENLMIGLAGGDVSREDLVAWLAERVTPA